MGGRQLVADANKAADNKINHGLDIPYPCGIRQLQLQQGGPHAVEGLMRREATREALTAAGPREALTRGFAQQPRRLPQHRSSEAGVPC